VTIHADRVSISLGLTLGHSGLSGTRGCILPRPPNSPFLLPPRCPPTYYQPLPLYPQRLFLVTWLTPAHLSTSATNMTPLCTGNTRALLPHLAPNPFLLLTCQTYAPTPKKTPPCATPLLCLLYRTVYRLPFMQHCHLPCTWFCTPALPACLPPPIEHCTHLQHLLPRAPILHGQMGPPSVTCNTSTLHRAILVMLP